MKRGNYCTVWVSRLAMKGWGENEEVITWSRIQKNIQARCYKKYMTFILEFQTAKKEFVDLCSYSMLERIVNTLLRKSTNSHFYESPKVGLIAPSSLPSSHAENSDSSLPSWLGLKNTLTASLQRAKTPPTTTNVLDIWHSTIWWWGFSNPGTLGNAEYLFIAIAPRSTVARSGSTW